MGSAQAVFETPRTGDIAFSPPTSAVDTLCGLASCGPAACPILCVIAHASVACVHGDLAVAPVKLPKAAIKRA